MTHVLPGMKMIFSSCSCMAVEWIPGDSSIEIVGDAMVITPSTPPAGE